MGTNFPNAGNDLGHFFQFVPTVPTFFRSDPRGFFTGKGQLLSQPRWPQGTNARGWMMFFGGDMGTRPKMAPKNRPVPLYMSDFLLSYCYGDILGTFRGRSGDTLSARPLLWCLACRCFFARRWLLPSAHTRSKCNLTPYRLHLCRFKHVRVLTSATPAVNAMLNVQILGLDRVKERLAALSGAEFNRACAGALNDEAFRLREEMQAHMRQKFDRVTPHIEKSPSYKKATPENMEVTVWPKTHGSKDIDAQKILQAQEFGGRRADKRFEVALKRAGVLPQGHQAVTPRDPFPGSDDGYGNISGPFIRHLLSYFEANPPGKNMSEKTRAKVHKTGNVRRAKGMQGPLMGGRRYFVVAKGQKLQGVSRSTHKEIDLKPGIWADVSGRISPVLLFVRAGSYKPLLDMASLRKEQERAEFIGKRLRARIHQTYEKKFGP